MDGKTYLLFELLTQNELDAEALQTVAENLKRTMSVCQYDTESACRLLNQVQRLQRSLLKFIETTKDATGMSEDAIKSLQYNRKWKIKALEERKMLAEALLLQEQLNDKRADLEFLNPDNEEQ